MKQILLIHDGDVVMNALGLVLGEEGYQVVQGRSLADMQDSPADLVLADVHAAGFEEAGAAANLKLQMGLAAPLFLFSSESEEQLKARTQALGADGYICTEWGFKRLISVVRFSARRRTSSGPPPTAADVSAKTHSRIIVIDDHQGARERLMRELRNQGYQVVGCGDLPGFERVLEEVEPDVIVADVVLPGAHGDEICRLLKARMTDRLIPIVLISGLPEAELRARAERAGADAHFRKQDGLPKLIQMLEALLSEIVF